MSSPLLCKIVDALRAQRFVHVHEDELQEGICVAFEAAGLNYEREVNLSQRDRIDFLVGSVGVEVKVAGSAEKVRRQLERYAASPRVDELVLVTDRLQAGVQAETMNGKPVRVVPLLGGLG